LGTTVLIADEAEADREVLARLLMNAGYRPLEATTGSEALSRARATQPGAAILEIPLPGLSGYELCGALKSEFGPDLPVIFLTGARTQSYDRVGGLLLGADDYLTKPYVPGELLVRLRKLVLTRHPQPHSPQVAHRLTRREHEILELLAEGLRHHDIACRLVISPKTVGTHVEHILRKLDVRSAAQAIAVAYRQEILRPPLVADTSAPDATIDEQTVLGLPFRSRGRR
jgi:DNA-binding NarL/FixJ family response regulator